jgi:hypothetical protein
MRNLMLHLLKWEFQPSRRAANGQTFIYNARRAIALVLADSPSLAGRVAGLMAREYPSARRLAALETRLAEERFPDGCPWTPEQVRDDALWPGGA